MVVGPFRADTDHDGDLHFWGVTFPSTFLVTRTLVVVHNLEVVVAVVVRNLVVALGIHVVAAFVNSGIRHPGPALILIFVPLVLMDLYILRDVTMMDHHSFDPGTNLLMVVPMDSDLVVEVHDPVVVLRSANGAVGVVVIHVSHNEEEVVVVVLHNILLVHHVKEVDHLVQRQQLRNVAPVAAAVVDIAGIDQWVVVVAPIAIQKRAARHRLALSAYYFYLPVRVM